MLRIYRGLSVKAACETHLLTCVDWITPGDLSSYLACQSPFETGGILPFPLPFDKSDKKFVENIQKIQ